jgi:hypothetical protein
LVLSDERLDGTGEAFDIGLHVERLLSRHAPPIGDD